MINETQLLLQLWHTKPDYLELARSYLESKAKRWESGQYSGKPIRQKMISAWAFHANQVISSYFEFGEILPINGLHVLQANCRSSEKLTVLKLTGNDGELTHLLLKYPELIVYAIFPDPAGEPMVYKAILEFPHAKRESYSNSPNVTMKILW